MCAASRALKSLVHLDSALRIAVSASPAGFADTGVPVAISKNPHQASSSFTLFDRAGRLLQDIGDGGLVTPYNTGKIGGDPGMTRTCDLRFRKPPLYPAELRDRTPADRSGRSKTPYQSDREIASPDETSVEIASYDGTSIRPGQCHCQKQRGAFSLRRRAPIPRFGRMNNLLKVHI